MHIHNHEIDKVSCARRSARTLSHGLWLTIGICGVLAACRPEAAHPYRDFTHYSKVFGRDKHYRLYLPREYTAGTRRYPVIYFFHGWGGRHRSDDNANLAYDSLQRLVDKYQVLLVMWDGNMEEKEPRPYNVGNHGDVRYQVQMKDYFPELVGHIDSAYRTLPDKHHRGIIGFSMGGFMSYFLAGKYPEMIGAAVAMTGSPEFFVGHPENHTLYPLRYTFENLREVKLRFHNSTADELTYLNTEVKEGAGWDGYVSFDYWQFEGGHVVDLPGETRVFGKAMQFVTEAFESQAEPAASWSHYDIYPTFSLYDYTVESDKRSPGFIHLKHVTPGGFGIKTLKWLPDGPPLDTIATTVTTAATYPPGKLLRLVKLRTDTRTVSEEAITTDNRGRLSISVDEYPYEIGVLDPANQQRDVIAFDYMVAGKKRFLLPGNNQFRIALFNRGTLSGNDEITVSIESRDSAIVIAQPTIKLRPGNSSRIWETNAINIRSNKSAPENAAPHWVRLTVTTTAGSVSNTSELVIPVMFDVPAFTKITIDDGRPVNDSARTFGTGNGDGIIDAGESVMIFADGYPLKLYTDDPCVVARREEVIDTVLAAKWPDGFTTISVVSIDEACADGHAIEFLAQYETKEFMPIKRTVHWGKVRTQVRTRAKK